MQDGPLVTLAERAALTLIIWRDMADKLARWVALHYAVGRTVTLQRTAVPLGGRTGKAGASCESPIWRKGTWRARRLARYAAE